MKKLIYSGLIVCFSTIGLQAQTSGSGGVTGGGAGGTQLSGNVAINIREGGAGKTFIRNRIPKDEYVDYQPYLFTKPRYGQVTLLDGTVKTGAFYYNLDTESLENAETDEYIPWNIVEKFTFPKTKKEDAIHFSNMKLIWPEGEYGGFLQDVQSSPYVKVKHYLEYFPPDWNPSTQMGSKDARIEARSQAYLKVNQEWIEIPDTKNKFFEMFGSLSEDLRKYARKNKLKTRNIEDIGKMITWVAKSSR